MRSQPSSLSVVEGMLASLGRHGFEVEVVALNPAMTVRPTGCITTLSFGEHVEGEGATCVARVEVKIDVRGDLSTGQLRRWRVARTYPVTSSDLGAVHLTTTLTLDGDVSSDFVQREAKASLAMMIALIGDASIEVSRLPPPRRPLISSAPVIYLKIKAAGEIAIGRSGLARPRSGLQVATPEARLMCNMICDRLVNTIIPEFIAVAGAETAEPRAVVVSEASHVVGHAKEGAVL
jgi:hypothetical protein